MVIIYLIFVIPIILLGIYLYSWSYHNASQEISRAQEAQLASYLDNLEREIAWLELQMFDIMEDNEIHRAAVTWSLLSNVERKNSLIYVQQRLVSIKNSSSLIKDVYVHMRPADQSVSAVTGISKIPFYTQNCSGPIGRSRGSPRSRKDEMPWAHPSISI